MSNQEIEIQKNDRVNVSIERLPGCQVKFNVSVEPKAVNDAYQQAIKAINKEVSVPGFRKGKAPAELIKDRFKSDIEREWRDIVVQTGFNEAVNLTHIAPLKEGHINRPVLKKCSKEDGAEFAIEFETRPTIPTVDINTIQLKKIQLPEVNEDVIENSLDNLLFHYSTWEPIEGRSVQKNDYVDIDIVVLDDPKEEVMSRDRVDVNEKQMPQWLCDLVIGLQIGESKEGTGSNSVKEFPVRVTVKAIWQANKPNLDDEFAKTLGLQTVEELRKKVIDKLHQDLSERQKDMEFQEIQDFLLKHYAFDLPSSYVKREAEISVQNHIQELKNANYSDSEINSHRSSIENAAKERSTQRLQTYFLLNKIAEDNHLEVSEIEVTQELTHQISLMASGNPKVNFNAKDVADHVRQIAFNKKITNFILEKATFV